VDPDVVSSAPPSSREWVIQKGTMAGIKHMGKPALFLSFTTLPSSSFAVSPSLVAHLQSAPDKEVNTSHFPGQCQFLLLGRKELPTPG